ncbi:GNAT family N-acetyltransferase [Jiangella mangrovi]|uniref:GNAT superfamily N-acetyltransferase n=1 Tax=Jiangella mangrovi TaxID=1524084 RepID=A0A7W9GQJ7_9ACTN|nr:GNAT family N-acetyltransferase [Jiangella mangrovi]MBB5788179.1 GNAT superfamily N-acetyltransferase [Jiangella mangrovi]
MKIRRLDDTGDPAYPAWYAAHEAGYGHDFPGGPRWLEHELQVYFERSDAFDVALWLAEDDDGAVVGAAAVVMPLLDNRTLGEVDLAVRPEARRRGIGTALLRALEDEAVRRGRTRFMADIEGPLGPQESPGTAFAERHGYTRRITEISRVQRPPFDLDALARLERDAAAHATDYRIVTWRDRVPDEHVAEYARMTARMSTDAPLGELDYEQESWDPARVRMREARMARMRRHAWCAAAVAPDGTFAGQTAIVLAADDDSTGMQGETIVDPRHRGHRLGLLLKIANLRTLLRDRPGVRTVWTWNADSNTYMIAVNEQLGYVPAGWLAGYQRDV